MTEEQKAAKEMAEAMGVTYVPEDQEDKKVDDKDVDDQTQDQEDKTDDDKQDDQSADDKGDDDTDADTDEKDKDSSGDQKNNDDKSSDQGDDKTVIPDSGKSDDGSDQAASFESTLTERSGGRFTSMADIDKALEEAPQNAFANEQIAKINEYVKSGGNLEDFVRTQTVDYAQMTPQQLIFAKMSMDNSDMTADEVQLLMEVDYGVKEGASDRDKKIAELKLKQASKVAKDDLLAHQAKWATPLADKTADRAANLQKWEAQLSSAVDSVESIDIALNKTDNFSFKLEDATKESIKGGYKELDKFFARYINKDGTEDTARFVRDMAILENFEAIVRSAASNSKSAGKKDVIKDVKNTDFEAKDKKDKTGKPLSIKDQAAKQFFGL